MKTLHYSFLALLTLCISGCDQTLDGFMDDWNNLGVAGVSVDSVGPQRTDMLLASPCPQVEIVDDLSSLSDFPEGKSGSDANLVSKIDIQNAESTCKLGSNTATVDLKVVFKGTLGPRAKVRATDKPFFTYPYFVAVTTPSGKIMAKEIFAASMTYNGKEKTHTYYENLRQIIPILNKDVARQYRILVGFQLSPDQLAYNREHMIPSDKAEKISTGAGLSRTKE
ncbi:MAG: hypothetical protein KDI13_08025 [Alphaproteobacteria bacterium]|nr:hypothetical protein [Alphaproteobacteria bacterium]